MTVPAPANPAPVLQPPGAGLPWWELLVARYLVFPRACRKLTWAASGHLFQEEGNRILALWDTLPSGRLGERVLIRRFPGIEDSSRNWSAAMTVEHLIIVGSGMRQIVGTLRRGEVPTRPARVEDVKPKGETTPEDVRKRFVLLLAETAEEEKIQPPLARGQGPRFQHPWFGPIDAFQWHTLLGLHQAIHRRQLEAIRNGLGVSRAGS